MVSDQDPSPSKIRTANTGKLATGVAVVRLAHLVSIQRTIHMYDVPGVTPAVQSFGLIRKSANTYPAVASLGLHLHLVGRAGRRSA